PERCDRCEFPKGGIEERMTNNHRETVQPQAGVDPKKQEKRERVSPWTKHTKRKSLHQGGSDGLNFDIGSHARLRLEKQISAFAPLPPTLRSDGRIVEAGKSAQRPKSSHRSRMVQARKVARLT